MDGKGQDGMVTSNQATGIQSINDVRDPEDVSVTMKDKYSYYYKNFVVCGFAIITGFGAVYSSGNLLTTFAGSLGFASLAVSALIAFFTVFTVPALIQSIGTRRSLVLSFLSLLLFVAGQFYLSPYTIIPAVVFYGIGLALFWAGGAIYLSKLSVDYGTRCNISHEKMISFANGYLMACYSIAILLGNALSSSILLPSDLDEQSVMVGNGSCNLRQTIEHIDPYNVHLMALRGVLLLSSCIAFIATLFFVDKVKGEDMTFDIKSFLFELKKSNVGLLKACIKDKPYILLGFPIAITSSLVQGYVYGSFPKVQLSA